MSGQGRPDATESQSGYLTILGSNLTFRSDSSGKPGVLFRLSRRRRAANLDSQAARPRFFRSRSVFRKRPAQAEPADFSPDVPVMMRAPRLYVKYE
jgi:hypothetical protein